MQEGNYGKLRFASPFFAGAEAPVPVRHPGGEALASLYATG